MTTSQPNNRRTSEETFDSGYRDGHRWAIDAAIMVVELRLQAYQKMRERRGANFPIGIVETELQRLLTRLSGLRKGRG